MPRVLFLHNYGRERTRGTGSEVTLNWIFLIMSINCLKIKEVFLGKHQGSLPLVTMNSHFFVRNIIVPFAVVVFLVFHQIICLFKI